MSFTHNELCVIERDTGCVVRGVKQFADTRTITSLRNAEYILAEVRNAGLFLCDPNTDAATRQEILERLGDLFRKE